MIKKQSFRLNEPKRILKGANHMKRITTATLILSFVLIFSACEKQAPEQETKSPTTSSTSTEAPIGKENETSSKTSSSLNIEKLVEEMSESKDELFQFPKLNETLLGKRAEEYNQKIHEIYKEWIDFGWDSENGDNAKRIRYFPYVDKERQLFSIVSQYVDTRGYPAYETAVFDLKDPAREVSFDEMLENFDWNSDTFRKRVESYFKNLYALDSRKFHLKRDSNSGLEIQNFEDFMKERMEKYDDEFREGLAFSLDEEGLTVYFTTGYPTFMETSTECYRVKKNTVDDLFTNETFGAMMAIINESTDAERNKLNIVDNIQPEGKEEGMSEKIFVSLEDDVNFYIRTLEFDVATSETTPAKEVYRRILKKGEAVSVLARIPEGIPTLQAVGEYRPKDFQIENASYSFFYDFFYNGLFGTIKIEFLEGEFGNG